jgi:hypothetical protein
MVGVKLIQAGVSKVLRAPSVVSKSGAERFGELEISTSEAGFIKVSLDNSKAVFFSAGVIVRMIYPECRMRGIFDK